MSDTTKDTPIDEKELKWMQVIAEKDNDIQTLRLISKVKALQNVVNTTWDQLEAMKRKFTPERITAMASPEEAELKALSNAEVKSLCEWRWSQACESYYTSCSGKFFTETNPCPRCGAEVDVVRSKP